MIRAIIDTNILVRASIRPQGTVGPVLSELRDGKYLLFYSDTLLKELIDVLGRPRLRTKYQIGEERIRALLDLILLRGELVVPTRKIDACRDSDDNAVLEAAVAAKADIIVSGDEDLLVLNPFEGIPIVRPSDFLVRLRAS
ncbi:MAG TPA: putative toxin-antitoxin system toxin component, PIN family [Thermoanaerobaculia bacterium]|nr:putative toxin-antitoxin system toxin component, PIN family [Thermoanaerobaculia bacterium]